MSAAGETRTVWILRHPGGAVASGYLDGYVFLTPQHRDEWMAQSRRDPLFTAEEQRQRRSVDPCHCPDCRERFHWIEAP